MKNCYKVIYNRILKDDGNLIAQDARWFSSKEEFEEWKKLYYKLNEKTEMLEIVSEGWDCD